MKTAKSKNGNGTLNKRGKGRKTAAQSKKNDIILARAIAEVTKKPRYGTGLTYGTKGLRYAVTDPVPPVNDGGKVVLNLAGKPDVEVVNTTYAHINKMTGNENFLDQQPPAPDFKTLADTFANSVTALKEAKRTVTEAAAVRDAALQALMAGYGIRLPYIQITSNGNTAVILTTGLPVRSSPVPTGVLSPPQNFRVDLNGTPGAMFFSCLPVDRARGYVIQCADASTMERNWMPFALMPNTRYNTSGMQIGKTFAFRIAATGGSNGQSDWSPEVVRTAA